MSKSDKKKVEPISTPKNDNKLVSKKTSKEIHEETEYARKKRLAGEWEWSSMEQYYADHGYVADDLY